VATKAVGDELAWSGHPLPPVIAPANAVWDPLPYEVGSGPERIAIVVWDDPAEELYDLLEAEINDYAADVAAAGFAEAFRALREHLIYGA
jgi:hypothetical protein